MVIKFADEPVLGDLQLWNQVAASGLVDLFTAKHEGRLSFAGRIVEGKRCFALAMVCPYVNDATGAPRKASCSLVKAFEPERQLIAVFDVLRDEAASWLASKKLTALPQDRHDELQVWL